jgi:hypothetical protein
MGMEEKIGATGEFPRGKIHSSDEGELRLRMAADHKKGVVILEFGKPVMWLGLDKTTALQLSANIQKLAEELP